MTPHPARNAALLLPVALVGCALVGYPGSVPAGPAPSEPAASGSVPMAEPRSPYGNPDSYEVGGETYRVLLSADGYDEQGYASWYGAEFEGRRTSSGEPFDPEELSAAHRTLPIPTWVEVTNLDNGRRLVVRINDRGPFVDTDQRIIDLSEAAARRLGVIGPGTARVRVRALTREELRKGLP